jgi:hypothetical protein
MAMKRTTTSKDLHDEIKKVLQKLNIPIQKLVGVVTDGRKEQWLVFAYYQRREKYNKYHLKCGP